MSENEITAWEPPAGYTLTRHEGHYVNRKGFRVDADAAPAGGYMPDGQIEVPHFDNTEPFIYRANDGQGPFASDEAKRAAAAGEPLGGLSPNVTYKPIVGGWVPTVYTLRHVDDTTPETEPATLGGEPLTPEREIAALEGSIAAAQARIADLKGASS